MQLRIFIFLTFVVFGFSPCWAQKPVFESEVITLNTTGHRVEVTADITKAKKLFLVANDGGDGYSFDWVDWVNPKLSGPMDDVVDLTQFEWKSASTGWGTARKNLNCEGNQLRINGETFKSGIGVHANSVIEFDLPDNHTFTKFTAVAGLDNGGTDQGGGNLASVQFQVFVNEIPEAVVDGDLSVDDHDIGKVLEQFEVHPDLEVSLFASEPMMVNPTNIDIDHLGRVWVCEVTNYRMFANKNAPFRDAGDRILILEDTDNDGAADKSTVFYQGQDIDSVHGICVLGDRAIVSAGDTVFYLIDTNGDSKADQKEVLFTGIKGTQHDHGIHAFVFGPDGKLYFNFGNAGKEICDKDGKPIVDMAGKTVNSSRTPYQEGMIFRCNLDGSEFETLAWNFRNNWEVCVDSFGRLWQSDNDDDGNRGVRINYVLEHGNYGFKDEITGEGWRTSRTGMNEEIPLRHFHQNDPGVIPNLLQTGAGSPTGICVYEGDLLSEVFHNQIIHCDAGPNIVRAYPVKSDGFGFSAEIVDVMDGARHNQWFRPSDVCVAPDGSLIVADWYDPGVGGHRMGDVERGRLFRVTPKGQTGKYDFEPADFSTAANCAKALMSPNLATRFLAWQSLQGMGDDAVSELEQLLKHKNPRIQARALWLLTKMPLVSIQIEGFLIDALNSETAEIAATAVRCIRQLDDIGLFRKLMLSINLETCFDEVAREFLIALSDRNKNDLGPIRVESFWKIARYPVNRWLIESLGIAARNHWDEILDNMPDENGFLDEQRGQQIVWRSRGTQTPHLLTRIIADQQTKGGQVNRFFRSMDFQKSVNQEDLADLVFGNQIKDEEKLNQMIPEVMKRVSLTSLSDDQQKVIDRFLNQCQGTMEFVSLVKQMKLEHRVHLCGLQVMPW